jgi:hypothetical protein
MLTKLSQKLCVANIFRIHTLLMKKVNLASESLSTLAKAPEQVEL